MKIEKVKKKVAVAFVDGSMASGNIYLNPGERIVDFCNDPKETFIVLTESKVESASILNKELFSKDGDALIINKASIKWIKDIS
jgi:hypothetical protein